MSIHNFANRQLCEYQGIFPTVVSLLDHVLFTIGNGYDIVDGMPHDGRLYINEWPELTPAQWDMLIHECHAREDKTATSFAQYDTSDRARADCAAQLVLDKAQYYPRTATDDMFTEEALFQQILQVAATMNEEKFSDRYFRPYPLSEKYSDIYHLNTKTPKWFVQIALNLCNAWVRFLQQELDTGHVWTPIPPGTPTLGDTVFKELFDGIKADADYDGWLDRPAPTRDYGDAEYTTTHLNMLRERSAALTELLDE
jgi:hypothetical protein